MKGVALTSGGKDSILAMHVAKEMGVDIRYMLVMLPEDGESMLYHTHNLHVLDLIARSTRIRLVKGRARKGAEVEALVEVLRGLDADLLITGGIGSSYQRREFERACSEAGIDMLSPLWGVGRGVYDMLLERGMDVIVVGVAALGLGREWLGRHLDEEGVGELLELADRYGFDPTGEGGDLDTLVLDAPMYEKRIEILKSRVEWELDRGRLVVEEARLGDKDARKA